MGAAFFWGAFAASSLVLGGLIALRFEIRLPVLGLIMGFGSGVLISAVAYELVAEAVENADAGVSVAIGLFAGCGTFFAGDTLIDRLGGADRKKATGAAAGASALAIVLGIVLDGSARVRRDRPRAARRAGRLRAMLAAVFLSNLPEAIAATSGLARSGWSGRNVIGLWLAVALVSGSRRSPGTPSSTGPPATRSRSCSRSRAARS